MSRRMNPDWKLNTDVGIEPCRYQSICKFSLDCKEVALTTICKFSAEVPRIEDFEEVKCQKIKMNEHKKASLPKRASKKDPMFFDWDTKGKHGNKNIFDTSYAGICRCREQIAIRIAAGKLTENQVLALQNTKGRAYKDLTDGEKSQIVMMVKDIINNEKEMV